MLNLVVLKKKLLGVKRLRKWDKAADAREINPPPQICIAKHATASAGKFCAHSSIIWFNLCEEVNLKLFEGWRGDGEKKFVVHGCDTRERGGYFSLIFPSETCPT